MLVVSLGMKVSNTHNHLNIICFSIHISFSITRSYCDKTSTVIPSTDCKYYHECWEGFPRSRKGCGAPLLFNEERDYCDFPRNVDCPPPVLCPPTASAYLEPAPAPVKPQPTMPGGEIIVNIPSTVAPYKSLIGRCMIVVRVKC